LIRSVLTDWEGQRIYLALDSSQLWGRFTVVRVALVYRGRALPVSWIVLASQSASVALENYQVILAEAAAVLPRRCQVILLADRGFFDQNLLIQARNLGWSFRIRLKSSFWVYRVNKPRAKVGRLMPPKDRHSFCTKSGSPIVGLDPYTWHWRMCKPYAVLKSGAS